MHIYNLHQCRIQDVNCCRIFVIATKKMCISSSCSVRKSEHLYCCVWWGAMVNIQHIIPALWSGRKYWVNLINYSRIEQATCPLWHICTTGNRPEDLFCLEKTIVIMYLMQCSCMCARAQGNTVKQTKL